jgi:hypothetical protein
MQANPDKFQAISIGRKTHEKKLSFMLQGNKIDCEDEVKLLGVTFDFKLTFNSHVSHISSFDENGSLGHSFDENVHLQVWFLCFPVDPVMPTFKVIVCPH